MGTLPNNKCVKLHISHTDNTCMEKTTGFDFWHSVFVTMATEHPRDKTYISYSNLEVSIFPFVCPNHSSLACQVWWIWTVLDRVHFPLLLI